MSEPMRVMWLLNHSSARKFEVAMLKRIGIDEIFLPKIYPNEINFRSASVDYSEDKNLTIPAEELAILNAQDWYDMPSREAWEIANKYFQVLFFILHKPGITEGATNNFKGAIIWRAYGLVKPHTYSYILRLSDEWKGNGRLRHKIKTLGNRFWFGEAYSHLHLAEDDLLKKRYLYLPLGLHNCSLLTDWTGINKRIYFVCPDIEFNAYYKETYNKFIYDFSQFNYSIAGAQSLLLQDPNVLGFVSTEEHAKNMREHRVMFYHSQESNHIHYHPFEAIRAGMPLVFMAGGLLDLMGGRNQPGRCENIKEAQNKIKRILNDDTKLINAIRTEQVKLLDPMRPENCEQAWKDGFALIRKNLEMYITAEESLMVSKRKRIAVIVPIGYRGGSLRAAKLLAHALWKGSHQKGEEVDVVLAHLDEPAVYTEDEFTDLPSAIKRRPYQWKTLDSAEALRAMRYAGYDSWKSQSVNYIIPDDNMQQFMDFDLWVIISDRLSFPLLPLRPYICAVYDYLQRYEAILPHGADQPFLNAVRNAECLLVTTSFTEQDALQYAGISPQKLKLVPMLAPAFEQIAKINISEEAKSYFIWTTNAAPHKNHLNAIKALKIYYEDLKGKLQCHVTGVNTKQLLKNPASHILPVVQVAKSSDLLKKNIRWLGELEEKKFQAQLAGALFLWHAGRIDNGTFSVIEAAHMGVPALSSRYPAMKEIDSQFSLNLQWMDANDPKNMAAQLKWMEVNANQMKSTLPDKTKLDEQSVEKLAGEYWKVVRECL